VQLWLNRLQRPDVSRLARSVADSKQKGRLAARISLERPQHEDKSRQRIKAEKPQLQHFGWLTQRKLKLVGNPAPIGLLVQANALFHALARRGHETDTSLDNEPTCPAHHPVAKYPIRSLE